MVVKFLRGLPQHPVQWASKICYNENISFPAVFWKKKKMRKLYMVELVCISILAMYQLKIKKQLKLKDGTKLILKI